MNRTFDPFHDIDRLFAEAARTPASVAMPMDLYRDGDKYVAAIDPVSYTHLTLPTNREV